MKSIIAATAIVLLAMPDPATLFASGDFAAAAAAAQTTLAQSPNDPGALLVAGTVALFHNDLAAAEADLNRVPAQDPAAPKVARLLAEVRRREAFSTHRDITFGPGRDVTKFVERVPLPVIPVVVNGRAALFQIDTGAPGIALDRDFAKSLALPSEPSRNAVFADGKLVKLTRAHVATFGLGGASVRDLSADLLPLHEMMHGPSKIDGVLGMDVLERFSGFTLDYVRGALVTYAPSAPIAVESETTVPFYIAGDHLLATRSVIAGVEGMSLIDTGLLGGGIVPSADVVRKAHLTLTDGAMGLVPSGAQQRLSTVTVPEVRIGTAVEHDIPGIYAPGPSPIDSLGFAPNGTISHGFFDHRSVTFDFTRMVLSISAHAPSSNSAASWPGNTRRNCFS